MADPVTIALGGKNYAIRPLTLGQLRRVLPAFAKAGNLGQDGIDAAVEIVAAALVRDHAAVKADDIEATVGELSTAVAAIAKLSGLVSAEAPPAGEA